MEILAPVGGEEQLLAAARSGADAVYLGTKSFNARRKADNFGGRDLKNAVAFCHGRGVRVHVTVNTLVTDAELPALYDTVREVAESGADAVILQDMASAALFRDYAPTIPRHASTQMSIHNAEGARLMQELGFSRAILARELSLREIRKIREAVDIELETFVHGALCMGFSGQCLLSAMLGERSGNRGLCAQPCRLDFRAGSRPFALSLKDACLIPHLQELQEAGVCSLKIEGRLRRPEYVATAVDACRKSLAGEPYDLSLLEKVFSRSGFTDGYLTGKRNLTMFGVRTEVDKAESAAVLGQLSGLYRRELSRVPVDMALTVQPGVPASLTATDGVHAVTVSGEVPEPVRSKPMEARPALEKTGGTPFVLRELTENCDPGYTAKLNPLRRDALSQLLALRETVAPHAVTDAYVPEPPENRKTQPKLRLRFETKDQIFDCPEAERIYLPIEEIDSGIIARFGGRLIGELPRLVFPTMEDALRERLAALKAAGLQTVCAGNPGTVHLSLSLGFAVSGGFDLNILNSRSLREWAQIGVSETMLSLENNLKNIPKLGGDIPRGLVCYGHLPLMLYRCCPMQGAGGCGSCDGRQTIRDRQGADFTVLCHRKQYSALLNAVPLYVGDKDLRGLDFVTAYFTTESREACREIASLLLRQAAFPGVRTLGPYCRTML